jgi:hypothetical protein
VKVNDLPAFERRKADLGATATGRELIELFFALAREPVDGYGPPDTDDNVVCIEARSRTGFHSINLKRQMTQLDARRDLVARTQFYVDLSFERFAHDHGLDWFTINYGEGPQLDSDLDLRNMRLTGVQD